LPESAQQFKLRLSRATGLTDLAINAAWPDWWSDDAEASSSAKAELRFSVARKLGLDPRSLAESESPRFVWDNFAKYKNFKGDINRDQPAITSFGISVSRMLMRAVPSHLSLLGKSASELRESILASQTFIRFHDLLGLLWGVGIPTIYLRVYPLAAKRMCAMATRSNDRNAILLAKDSQYPASVAFHLAHEIGHIALGHINDQSALIDMEDPAEEAAHGDDEEISADQFALELLTGDPHFSVHKEGRGRSAAQLAAESIEKGNANRIEPGTLALCYGHATQEWPTVQAAMPRIYAEAIPAWSVTNKIANRQIAWEELNDESASFLQAVMGGI